MLSDPGELKNIFETSHEQDFEEPKPVQVENKFYYDFKKQKFTTPSFVGKIKNDYADDFLRNLFKNYIITHSKRNGWGLILIFQPRNELSTNLETIRLDNPHDEWIFIGKEEANLFRFYPHNKLVLDYLLLYSHPHFPYTSSNVAMRYSKMLEESESEKNLTREQLTQIKKIPFPKYNYRPCEGQWIKDRKSIMPVPHKQPWPLESQFLTRLWKIQEQINDTERERERKYAVFKNLNNEEPIKSPIEFKFGTGKEESKLDPKDKWEKGEYYDSKNNICWDNGFSTHYVERYNVVPSKEFFRYVMDI